MKAIEVAIPLTEFNPTPTQFDVRGGSAFVTSQQLEGYLSQGGTVRNELVYRVRLGEFDRIPQGIFENPFPQRDDTLPQESLYRFGRQA